MPQKLMSQKEFADKLRKEIPELAQFNDAQIVNKVLERRPELKDRVDIPQPWQGSIPPSISNKFTRSIGANPDNGGFNPQSEGYRQSSFEQDPKSLLNRVANAMRGKDSNVSLMSDIIPFMMGIPGIAEHLGPTVGKGMIKTGRGLETTGKTFKPASPYIAAMDAALTPGGIKNKLITGGATLAAPYAMESTGRGMQSIGNFLHGPIEGFDVSPSSEMPMSKGFTEAQYSEIPRGLLSSPSGMSKFQSEPNFTFKDTTSKSGFTPEQELLTGWGSQKLLPQSDVNYSGPGNFKEPLRLKGRVFSGESTLPKTKQIGMGGEMTHNPMGLYDAGSPSDLAFRQTINKNIADRLSASPTWNKMVSEIFPDELGPDIPKYNPK